MSVVEELAAAEASSTVDGRRCGYRRRVTITWREAGATGHAHTARLDVPSELYTLPPGVSP